MGQIKNLYKKAHGSFNNPEHKRHWQGGVGIFVMTLFVLSSLVFNRTVQALNQAAGNYGYYSGSYGYGGGADDGVAATSDAPPAAPTSLTRAAVSTTTMTVQWTAPLLTTSSTTLDNLQDYLFHYGTSSLSTCASGAQFAASSVASGGSVAVGSSSTGVVVTATDTTPESGDTDSVQITGLTENTTYYFGICTRDANLNESSALTGSLVTTASSGSSGSGQAATSTTSVPTTTTTTTVATTTVPGGSIVPPAGAIATVTAVKGNLTGTATQALAAVKKAGVSFAKGRTEAQAKQTATDARKQVFGANNEAIAEVLVAIGSAKDTAAALKQVDAQAVQILENALAVAAAVRSELGATATETSAIRTARFLNTVLPPAVLALAVSDVRMAETLAQSLVVAAAVGNIQDDLRKSLLAQWVTLGIEKADRELANKELELKEKMIAGPYIAFYRSGPETGAQWSLYLAAAHGARHPETVDQKTQEAAAMVVFNKRKALVTWPFGPLHVTKAISDGKDIAGAPANVRKQINDELNAGLLDALQKSSKGEVLSKAQKALISKDRRKGTARALAEHYYGLGFSLIQSAARAALTGVRALPL